jgi:hypothetical protein
MVDFNLLRIAHINAKDNLFDAQTRLGIKSSDIETIHTLESVLALAYIRGYHAGEKKE